MGKPLRVLQVGMSPYYGGTESFIMNQYRKINRDIIQFDFLNVFHEPIACESEINEYGGVIYPLNMSRRNGIRQYRRNLNLFFAEYSEKFDIIHCNFQSLINIDLLIYAKKFGIKGRIAHAHNAGYGTEPNILQKLIIAGNKKRLSKCATAYYACSSLAGRWMFGHNNATVIHNAIDTKQFVFNVDMRNKIRSLYGLKDETLILFVGRLDPQKNPFFLIDIFSEIIKFDSNWKLFIIGDGVLRPKVEQQIEKYGLKDSVKMLGSRNDVKDFLQAADCFLLPSKFEGLGIVLIEAQAAGLPCFTSKDVVPSDVNITGLVRFISLEKNSRDWANDIVNYKFSARNDQFKTVKSMGYDADSSIHFIENEYLSMK